MDWSDETDTEQTEEQAREVVVVSTRTRDWVPSLDGGAPRDFPGGPAHYMSLAFERLCWPCRVITGVEAQVQVLRGSGGEQYIIPELPRIPLPQRLDGAAVLLSPIMQEIDPETVPAVSGLLALDLQGFVREANTPSGQASRKFDLTHLLERTDVVKASEDEFTRLTVESQRALRDTILLTTFGVRGARVTRGGEEIWIEAQPVATNNTIGAGDMFLAAFVCALLQHEELRVAGEAGARFTEGVLRERLSMAAERR